MWGEWECDIRAKWVCETCLKLHRDGRMHPRFQRTRLPLRLEQLSQCFLENVGAAGRSSPGQPQREAPRVPVLLGTVMIYHESRECPCRLRKLCTPCLRLLRAAANLQSGDRELGGSTDQSVNKWETRGVNG